MINYSFIIPHKNCPGLLQRCVDSIPERDDVQVIVVDDNSEEGKKPSLKERKNIQVILLDATQAKGAGRARNLGLTHAEGKWLLFADADDYYNEGFLDVLDNELNDGIDVLYFDFYNNFNITDSSEEPTKYHNYLVEYIENPDSHFRENRVKFGLNAPWNKVYRSDFVKDNKVYFEEIPAGNDIRFVHSCGALANRIKCISDKLYYYIKNKDGITNKKMTKEAIVKRIKTSSSHVRFIQDLGVWDIGDTSWPPIIDIFNNYGLLFSLKVYFLKLWYYRPVLYVHFKHMILLFKEKAYNKKMQKTSSQ